MVPAESHHATTNAENITAATQPTREMFSLPSTSLQSIPVIKSTSDWSRSDANDASGASNALLNAIRFAGVKFLRFAAVDAMNAIRCKAVPLDRILGGHGHHDHKEDGDNKYGLNSFVTVAEVCIAGLPSYADCMIPDTKLDARR
eukprot:8164399-Ditylum_brightwellii.AAC.1